MGDRGLLCRDGGACSYVTDEGSCQGTGGAALASLPVLQLEVQDTVPFKASAVSLGPRVAGACASSA